MLNIEIMQTGLKNRHLFLLS